MAATPEVKVDEAQDELAAALESSKNPGAVEDPEPEPEEVKEPEKKEEAAPADEKKEEAKDEEEADPLFDVKEQNRELRQILRQQKREMSVLQAKLLRLEKRSVAATKKVEDEVSDEEALFGRKKEVDDKAAEPADDLSPVEQIQTELASLAKIKGPILETLLETMELNPKYEDVRSVCSQAHFDDIFEAIGDSVAAKDPSKDAAIAALEAEAAVWKMANPYKYMYDLIKQYHPKYAARQPKKGTEPAADDKGKAKPKEPAKAPTSLANVPGKGSSSNAWTAARIDEMDESELDKVPADIYDKYLRGELD